MHPHLSAFVADEHRRDLMRAAEHHRLLSTARAGRPSHSRNWTCSVRLPALDLLRRVHVLRTPCEQP
jgi:hypothetical protein